PQVDVVLGGRWPRPWRPTAVGMPGFGMEAGRASASSQEAHGYLVRCGGKVMAGRSIKKPKKGEKPARKSKRKAAGGKEKPARKARRKATGRPKYTLHVEPSVNGHVGPATILARDPDGNLKATDKANLMDGAQLRSSARRLAEKLQVDP